MVRPRNRTSLLAGTTPAEFLSPDSSPGPPQPFDSVQDDHYTVAREEVATNWRHLDDWFNPVLTRDGYLADTAPGEFFSPLGSPELPQSLDSVQDHPHTFAWEERATNWRHLDDGFNHVLIPQSLGQFMVTTHYIDSWSYSPSPGEQQQQPLEGSTTVVIGAAESCMTCAICLEDFEVGAKVRAIECSHKYHEACLTEWLRRSRSCPVCRFKMSAVM